MEALELCSQPELQCVNDSGHTLTVTSILTQTLTLTLNTLAQTLTLTLTAAILTRPTIRQ